VCSDEFGPLARAESQVLGIGALPLIAIPHPLAGNTPDLVAAKARAITAEVRAAVTDPPAMLTSRYRNQFLSLTERRLTAGAVCVEDACAIDPAIRVQSERGVR
jgi:hypothetical protein